jgi:predicted DNA-binding transcriptional regulator AlpA
VSLFLDAAQCAELLGVSERTFQKLRYESWMPHPVELGPRMVRWIEQELRDCIAGAPRLTARRSEPSQLATSKAPRRKVSRRPSPRKLTSILDAEED